MTNITKASQQALAALETCRIRSVTEWEVTDVTPKNVTQAIDALRAALQDKAVEAQTVAIDHLRNERRDGTTGHIWPPVKIGTKLFAAQPAPVVPDDHPLAVFAKECRLGAYTDHEVIKEAGKALAASQQKGGQHG